MTIWTELYRITIVELGKDTSALCPLYGVPQGSIPGPLFFNVYTCNFFSKLILLSSPVMRMIIPLLLPGGTTEN